MNRILGLPRNLAVVVGAIVLAALALGLGLFFPWGSHAAPAAGEGAAANTTAPPQPSAGDGIPPAPVTPIPPPLTRLPSVLDVSKEPSMAGLSPTLITVNFDNLQMLEALAAFSSQTSISLSPVQAPGQSAPNLPPLSMHLQNAPFFEGFFELLHDTRAVAVTLSATNARLTFPNAPVAINNINPDSIGRWSLSGPFAMVICRIDHTLDLSADAGRSSRSPTMMTCSIYAEPALSIVQFPTTVVFEEFSDDKNQPIAAASSHINTPNRDVARASFLVNLTPAADRGQRISRLRARATFIVATRVETVRTSDPADTVSQTVGDLDVHIGPLMDGDNHSLDIRYSRGKMDSAKWGQFRAMLPNLIPTFLSPTDTRTPFPPTAVAHPESADVFVVHMSLPASGPIAPHHLRLDVPLEFREVSVPFEFHDLILP